MGFSRGPASSLGLLLLAAASVVSCTSDPEAARPRPAASAAASTETVPPAATADDQQRDPVPAPRLRSGAMLATVRHLAGRIGPREATSAGFGRAADHVETRFRRLGYDVARQTFRVPAGTSWGVGVPAGESLNLVARPAGFEPTRPYVLVGAHLDTVPQAPGAEDNASGVAVLLETARRAARRGGQGPGLPVVFVAFGAEEPRGPGDAGHHFGSRQHIAALTGAARASLRAMVSLDRVGTGRVVPVCTGGRSPLGVRDGLLEAAGRVGVPAIGCTDNRSSDHWSYEQAGVAAARLGGTPYPAYHSPADRPGVVSGAQLRRTARVLWAWLQSL